MADKRDYKRFSDLLRGKIQKDRYQDEYEKATGEKLFKDPKKKKK